MKKGFTLIELLATVILLGILVVIAYPTVLDIVEKRNQEIENSKLDVIYNAADTFINDNIDEYPKILGNEYCFLISNLNKENLIPIDVGTYKTKSVNVKIGKVNSYSIIDGECVSND